MPSLLANLAAADPPDLPDHISPDACFRDRCVARWEGPSMGGCMGDVVSLVGAPVASDHLELDLIGPGDGDGGTSSFRPGSSLRIAAIPRMDGTLETRVWRRGASERDEPFAGGGTWQRSSEGWQAELHLPLSEVLAPLEATRAVPVGVRLSDGEGGRQESVIETLGTMRLWDSYPPTIDTYDQMAAEQRRFASRAR